MRPERIDQVVPSFGGRDAIGVHILHLRDLLRDLGYRSDVWCRGAFPEVRSECRLIDELPARPRPATWWLYHLSNGSPAADVISARSEPLVVDYHNITPAALLERWIPWAAESSDEGRAQLRTLAPRAFFAVADSSYNEGELIAAEYGATTVAPPLFALGRAAPDAAALSRLRAERSAGGADWLFVGRLSPSKGQHDVVKAFASYRAWHDPRARLHLVGTELGDSYGRAVGRFASRLGLGDAVRLAGSVSDAELSAYYATADVFVCASSHEGFCIPLVEAMHAGVPVVAYDAGAVAGTAGNAALVIADKSAATLATAVHRVLSDEGLRSRLVEAGHRRAAGFSLDRSRARWTEVLDAAVLSSDALPVAR